MRYPIAQERRESSCQVTYLASYLFILIHSVDLSIICINTTFYQYILLLYFSNCKLYCLVPLFFQVYIGYYAFIILNIFKCSQVWWCMWWPLRGYSQYSQISKGPDWGKMSQVQDKLKTRQRYPSPQLFGFLFFSPCIYYYNVYGVCVWCVHRACTEFRGQR